MRKNLQLLVYFVFCLITLQSLSLKITYASTLSGAKDTITTSRPSAATPLYVDQSANDTYVGVFDNNSIFLASDSATILPDTGETINTGLIVASQSAAQQLPSPISYWKFDDNTGSTVTDAMGVSNGTWGGTLGSQWTTGKINSAGSFNGTDNRVATTSTSNYNFGPGSASFSIWTYPTGSAGYMVTYMKGSFQGWIITGNGQFVYNNLAGPNDTGCSFGGYTLNQWNFLTVVVDREAGFYRCYKNGLLINSGAITQNPLASTSNLTFGSRGSPVDTFWSAGYLDEAGLWPKALNSLDVLYLYNATAGRQLTTSTNYRSLYFSSPISNKHHAGDTVIASVTAKHTVQFTPITGVASTGKIVIAFPGIGSNSASPSATTFAFNNLQASNITTTGASCGSYTLAPPVITCNLNAALAPGTPVTMTIGSSTPALVNPTKTNAGGTSDAWRMTIQTTDSADVVLDDAKIAIATVDAVKVYGDVDASITFTITGVNNGVALSTQATGCADSTQNAQSTTSTEVNLGFLRNGQINMAAQLLSVSTNGAQGYVISATSSGKLLNPTTGWGIYGMNGDIGMSANNTPAPATFRASGLEGFGISACGPRTGVNANQWGTSSCTTAFSSGCKYANPWNTGSNSYNATLGSYTGGPVSNDLTVVKYAATISGTTPPGNYRTVFTYVATATF